MLKITRKVEYALIALRHMQSKNVDELTSAKEIANQYGVPQQLLAKTLQQMARDRILEAIFAFPSSALTTICEICLPK